MQRFPVLLGVLFWGIAYLAGNASESFVLNLPNSAPLPTWLELRQSESSKELSFATRDFAVKPPEGSGDLAVTFYFTETEGGALHVFWQGNGKAETLSDNLYEGVAMANQRTLLIPKATIGAGGVLTIQSTSSSTGVSRIEWCWTTPATVAVADSSAAPVLFRIGSHGLHAEEVSGDAPAATPADQYRGKVVTAVIRQDPMRIDQGTDFIATIEEQPRYARIDVQLLGVPLDRNIAVWINELPINQLALDTPDLNHSGYSVEQKNDMERPIYVGWRKGTILVPGSALHEGENRFRFAWIEPETSGAAPIPLALKNLIIQMNYDAATSTSSGLVGPANESLTADVP